MWWNQMGYAGQQHGFMGSNMAPMSKYGYGTMGYGMQGSHMAGQGMAGPMGGQAMGYMGTGYMPGYGMEGLIGGTLMTLITVLFWVLILVGVVFFVKGLWQYTTSQKQPGVPVANSAMEILRQRFAKGEISRQEFEERSQVLA